MVRTQIQLTDTQVEALRQLSSASGRSMADLIREGVDQLLAAKGNVTREERTRRALEAAGRFASGQSDVSREHDRHLSGAFGQ